MHDLTGFQRDLLVVIAGIDEPHGLAIKDELEEYYENEVNHGRLYPNLDELVSKGLVEKGQKDRRTNVSARSRKGTPLPPCGPPRGDVVDGVSRPDTSLDPF